MPNLVAAIVPVPSIVVVDDDAIPDSVAATSRIEQIISLIDLTDLDDERRPDGIAALLADSASHHTAAVCVWPEFVARASRELAESEVRVATVANFPTGTGSREEVAADVAMSLAVGADEIDVVLPWQRFLDGDIGHARDVLVAAAEQVDALPNARLKVILETGQLAKPATIAAASHLAIECGADFLKTSTGKIGVGATPEAVVAMLDVIALGDGSVGIKPSGGIKTIADASELLDLAVERLGDAWVTPQTFRFGASSLLAEALAALRGDPAN